MPTEWKSERLAGDTIDIWPYDEIDYRIKVTGDSIFEELQSIMTLTKELK